MRTKFPAKTQKAEPQVEETVASSVLGFGLSLRQSQFLAALLDQVTGKNPTRIDPTGAALSIGIPKKQASKWASLMMGAVPVKRALHVQLQAQIEAGNATPMRWLAEVAKLALVEPPTLKDFYHPDGTLKSPQEWTVEMAAQVSELQSEEIWEGRGEERVFSGWTKKVKLHPRYSTKLSALDMLAKYHKLIVQTLELTGKDGADLFPSDQSEFDNRAKRNRAVMLSGLGQLIVDETANVH